MIILIFSEYLYGILHPMRWVLWSILFHRRENLDLEKLSNLPKLAQMSEEMELELRQSDSRTCALNTTFLILSPY